MLEAATALDGLTVADGDGPGPCDPIGVPPRDDWVIIRPRLHARLSSGANRSLTVVTGPPGAGKTVAVASWASGAKLPGPLAWVSCDGENERPEIFWRKVQRALRHAGVPIGSARRSADGHNIVEYLTSAVASRTIPVVLVLDHFQTKRRSELGDGLAYLLQHGRPVLRLVLIARIDPPVPLQRYRLSNEFTEIRASDLAFTDGEAATLLAQHGVVLRPSALRALRERAEGWAAGIRLAAMSMERLVDPNAFAAQFAGDDHAVVDYLVEEALDSQPAEIRWLMLATSVAKQVNSELALALVDGAGNRAFAEMIPRNPFVTPVGHGWYRYHRMFRETLRLVLHHENPDEVPRLNRRAAAFFATKGMIAEAVRHAVQAGDWEHASRLVVDHLTIGQVLGLGRERTLAGVFDDLPDGVLTRQRMPEPTLLAAAVALGQGDVFMCATMLKQAESILADFPDDQAVAARRSAAVIHLLLGTSRDIAARSYEAPPVEHLLAQLPDALVQRRPELGALVDAARGRTEFQAGRLEPASAAFRRAITAAAVADSTEARRYCLGYLALAEALSGRYGRAAAAASQESQLPVASTVDVVLPSAVVHVARAWVHLARFPMDQVGSEIQKAEPSLSLTPDVCVWALHEFVKARAALVRGSPQGALDILHVTQRTRRQPPWIHRLKNLLESAALTAIGEPRAAREAAERAGGTAAPDSAVALARIHLQVGDLRAAARTLRAALYGRPPGTIEVRIDAVLLDAQLSAATGDISRARRCIDRALSLAERDEIRLQIAMARSWLGPFLRRDLELLRRHQRLLAPLHIAPSPSVPSPDGHAMEPTVFGQLSAREVEVLSRVARMLTSEEIAEELYISVNTVKTHLKNIYRKLAVTRRFEAVRRAQRLDLILVI